MSENNDIIICKHCNTENPSTFRFCTNCGEILTQPEAEKPEMNLSQSEAENPEIEIHYEPVEEAEAERYEEAPEIERVSGTVEGNGVNQVKREGNIGFSIASLVTGILSMVCCCATGFSILLAIAAIVLGIITLCKQYDGKGMAIAGIITGGIGLILGVFVLIAFFMLDDVSYYDDIYQFLE